MKNCHLSACLIIFGIFILGCPSDPKTDKQNAPNSVVEFFDGAERQTETSEDRLKVRNALNDILTLTADSLRTRRYADYQGTAGAWSVTTVLEKHFVAHHPMELDTVRFYSDCRSDDARKLIERHLAEVAAAIKADSIE